MLSNLSFALAGRPYRLYGINLDFDFGEGLRRKVEGVDTLTCQLYQGTRSKHGHLLTWASRKKIKIKYPKFGLGTTTITLHPKQRICHM